MSEIEVTAQAYEDVQELNKRLLEQLKEKEDANIKLMSERIKSNTIQQLLTEEKDLVTAHLTSVQQEVIVNRCTIARCVGTRNLLLTYSILMLKYDLWFVPAHLLSK